MAWGTSVLCVVVGEPERRGSTTFVSALVPTLWPPRVSPALVRGGNSSCEQVVGDGVFSYERSCQR
jgi:hypothetical protein